jgi:hypothetical protein
MIRLTTPIDLTVDLKDPDSVGAALAAVNRLVGESRAKYNEAGAEADKARERVQEAEELTGHWEDVQDGLIALARSLHVEIPDIDVEIGLDKPKQTSNGSGESSTAKALRAIKAINRDASIAEIAERMPEVKRKTIGWALWTLASEGAIQKAGYGRYAPKEWTPKRVTTNYFEAAQMDLPTPSDRADQSSPNGQHPVGSEGREQSGEVGSR